MYLYIGMQEYYPLVQQTIALLSGRSATKQIAEIEWIISWTN